MSEQQQPYQQQQEQVIKQDEYKYSNSTFVLDKFLKSQFKIADYILYRSTLVKHNDSRVDYPEDVNKIQKFELSFKNEHAKNPHWNQENDCILIVPSEESKLMIEDKDNIIFWLIFDKAISARSIYNYNLSELKCFVIWWTFFKIQELEHLRSNIIRYYQSKEKQGKVEEQLRQLKLSLKTSYSSRLNNGPIQKDQNVEFFESFKERQQARKKNGASKMESARSEDESLEQEQIQRALFDYLRSFYDDNKAQNKSIPSNLLKSEFDWWFSLDKIVLDRVKMKVCIYGFMQKANEPTIIKDLNLEFDWIDFGSLIDKYRTWFYKILWEKEDCTIIKTGIEKQRTEHKKWIKSMTKMLESKYNKIIERSRVEKNESIKVKDEPTQMERDLEPEQARIEQQQEQELYVRGEETNTDQKQELEQPYPEQGMVKRRGAKRKAQLKDGKSVSAKKNDNKNKKTKKNKNTVLEEFNRQEPEQEQNQVVQLEVDLEAQLQNDYMYYFYSQNNTSYYSQDAYSTDYDSPYLQRKSVNEESDIQHTLDLLRQQEDKIVQEEITVYHQGHHQDLSVHQDYSTSRMNMTQSNDSIGMNFNTDHFHQDDQYNSHNNNNNGIIGPTSPNTEFNTMFSQNLFRSDSFLNF